MLSSILRETLPNTKPCSLLMAKQQPSLPGTTHSIWPPGLQSSKIPRHLIIIFFRVLYNPCFSQPHQLMSVKPPTTPWKHIPEYVSWVHGRSLLFLLLGSAMTFLPPWWQWPTNKGKVSPQPLHPMPQPVTVVWAKGISSGHSQMWAAHQTSASYESELKYSFFFLCILDWTVSPKSILLS